MFGLKGELAEAMKEKEEQTIKELKDAISASGKTVEDWIAAVKGDLEK